MARKPPASPPAHSGRPSDGARAPARPTDAARRSKPARAGKAGKGGGGGGVLRALFRGLVHLLLAVAVGLGLGAGLVGLVLYRSALSLVDRGLPAGVGDRPGRVWSAPIEVWAGLALPPEVLVKQLQAAGYTVVPKASAPGEVQASGDAVLVKRKEERGNGWKVPGGQVLVTFAEGRVASVSPEGKATFPPAVMATLRGADNENRQPVPLERMPAHLRQAVLAIEDARFYDHPGLDALGVARAMWVNVLKGRVEQGGSTLTQQLVKNVWLSGERTADRKAKEALIAIALERRYSKDDILELYLNEIYLGQAGGSSVCGVDAASRAYFGKPVEKLALGESATLAGMIHSPNQLSPLRHPAEAEERRNVVLDRMVEAGFISAADSGRARVEKLATNPTSLGWIGPWAVDQAVEQVEGDLGGGAIARQALEVQTTLSPPLQALAERAVKEGLAEVLAEHPELGEVQAALVAVRGSDGAIVAMVGGRDYAASPYNRARMAKRQVGSTVKPLTALYAMEADPGLSGATPVNDTPVTLQSDGTTWTPRNYDGNYLGRVTLRRAIETSRNVPAVLLAARLGFPTLQAKLRGLGLDGATHYPSVALGGFGATPLELAGAYAVFVGDGRPRSPGLVTRASTPAGDAVWTAPTPSPGARPSAPSRWLVTELMRGVLRDGTGKKAPTWGVGPGAFGKTGTTDRYVDAWFAGGTGEWSVVVWVGFDKNQPVGLTGGAAALPVWARFVAGTGTSDRVPRPPDGVVAVEVCKDSDRPACGGCELRTEYFRVGQVPPDACAGALTALEVAGLGADPDAPAPADPSLSEVAPAAPAGPAAGPEPDRIGPDGRPVPE